MVEQHLDHTRNNSSKIWIVREMDLTRFGSDKSWIVQEMDFTRFGSCKIWIGQDLDCAKIKKEAFAEYFSCLSHWEPKKSHIVGIHI